MTIAPSVPRTIGELDPAWITSVLRADATIAADTSVTAVRAEQIAMDTGFSSHLYRLHLTGDAAVPSSLIVKLPGDDAPRHAMDLLDGYRREVAFYRDVAPRAPLGTPRAHVARMGEGSDFVLVLEDLQDWDNADHVAGLSLEQARMCIAQLAALHGWSTDPANAALLDPFPSLDTPVTRELFPLAFAPSWHIYLSHARRPVPPKVAAFAERFAEHSPQALAALTERRMLLHGDIRADNLFFARGTMKIVDFQFTAWGVGASDIGYLLSQGLPAEVRTGRDEELVRSYLDALRPHGVDGYGFDEAWRHYRFAVAYYLFLPVLATAAWDGLPERARELCLRLVERAVAAIDEIDALAVFA